MARLELLFICIGNTCRSVMAEAMARQLGGDRVRAQSAGLAPTGRVSDRTKAVLEEMGYDTTGLASTGLDAVPLAGVDVVVSLVGPEGLRLLPPNLACDRVVWSISDPYGEDLAVYRRVARGLELRVRRLLRELGALDGVS